MVDSLKTMDMEQIQKQGLCSSLPILQRLDRLERLVQFLEEKKSLSGTRTHSFSSTFSGEAKWKTLSSALHQLHYKGTLLERLDIIENRLLQLELSMEMQMVNKLTSSFFPSEKLECSTTFTNSNDDFVKVQDDASEINCERNSLVSATSKKHKRRFTVIRPKKWLGLLRLRACGK